MDTVIRIKRRYECWLELPVTERHQELKLNSHLDKYFRFSALENDFPYAMAERFDLDGKAALDVYGYTLDLNNTEIKFVLVAAQLNFAMFHLCQHNYGQVEIIIQNIDQMLRGEFSEMFLYALVGFS